MYLPTNGGGEGHTPGKLTGRDEVPFGGGDKLGMREFPLGLNRVNPTGQIKERRQSRTATEQ